MNKKQKKMLIRIIVTFLLLIGLSFIPSAGYVRFGLYLVPYLVIGYDILKKAFKGIRNRQVFDENFLMAVATVGAIALGDYQEGTAVMLFYQIGELFQSYAVGKSRKNISDLMDIRPDYANVEHDGRLEQVDPDEVEVGTLIVVQPGEKIPIDGGGRGKLCFEYQCSYGGKPAKGGGCGAGGYQRMHQYDGSSKDSYHKGIRGIYGVKDSGSGGEFQLEEVALRKFYF